MNIPNNFNKNLSIIIIINIIKYNFKVQFLKIYIKYFK